MLHHQVFVDITTREKTNFVAVHHHKLPILRRFLTKSLGMFLSNLNYILFQIQSTVSRRCLWLYCNYYLFSSKDYECSNYHPICKQYKRNNPESCEPTHKSYPFMRKACMESCGRCGGEVRKIVLCY